MEVLLQGLDSSIQTKQFLEQHVRQEHVSARTCVRSVFNVSCILVDVIYLGIISNQILKDFIFNNNFVFHKFDFFFKVMYDRFIY